jgi:alpha-galactosidase
MTSLSEQFPPVFQLRAAGVGVVVDARGDALPRIVHWGADLGEVPPAGLAAVSDAAVPPVPHSSWDVPVVVGLLPEASRGWLGRAGLEGSRDGEAFAPRFVQTGLTSSALPDGGAVLEVEAEDAAAQLRLRSVLALDAAGLLSVRHELTNTGDAPYEVRSLVAALPVPATSEELLDLTGRWCRERSPQRHPWAVGSWVRENRHGRTGHDATIGLMAGTAGFGFGHGEVRALHVAWSGDHVSYAERTPSGVSLLGGGELLLPGEVVLAPGESYAAPEVLAAWSGHGLDGISARFHDHLRARPSHPRSARPVTLNTWEAVYFDHDLDRLKGLADTAAELGVERYVLDDGWFRHRRHDRAGLGDWFVDEGVWPDGLTPLVEHVTKLGLQFGLWVEPEMVNPDSDLAREHPEWVLRLPSREPMLWRNQQVLDVAEPGAFAYLLERLDALLTDHDISYLKWDHNRDLVDAAHHGRPGVHAQTLAVYRLLDELRARHPGVEIESCASGGARVDLGILARTDRIWTSDCNDALERQSIQRWTGLFIAPELVGAHVGPPRSHTTHRVHDLSFRAATALFGHFGIEWDIASASPAEQQELAAWIALHKRLRPLLHGGRVVRVDHPDPAVLVHGIVAPDRASAAFAVVRLATSVAEVPGLVRLPGLDPARSYRVRPAQGVPGPAVVQRSAPPWLTDPDGIVLPGSALAAVGVQAPALHPEQALVLEVEAV